MKSRNDVEKATAGGVFFDTASPVNMSDQDGRNHDLSAVIRGIVEPYIGPDVAHDILPGTVKIEFTTPHVQQNRFGGGFSVDVDCLLERSKNPTTTAPRSRKLWRLTVKQGWHNREYFSGFPEPAWQAPLENSIVVDWPPSMVFASSRAAALWLKTELSKIWWSVCAPFVRGRTETGQARARLVRGTDGGTEYIFSNTEYVTVFCIDRVSKKMFWFKRRDVDVVMPTERERAASDSFLDGVDKDIDFSGVFDMAAEYVRLAGR